MPRQFQGRTVVKIPVPDILRYYTRVMNISLEDLAEQAAEKIMEYTIRFGTRRDGTPVSKKLRTHIKSSIGKFGGDGVFIAGAFSPHAHLLEDGHLLVRGGKLGKGGVVVGFVKGYHFVYDAEQDILQKAYSVVQNAMNNNGFYVRS